MTVTLDLPEEVCRFRLPKGVADRLQSLLDAQDGGRELSASEKNEAEGLVDLAETLTFLKLRATRPE